MSSDEKEPTREICLRSGSVGTPNYVALIKIRLDNGCFPPLIRFRGNLYTFDASYGGSYNLTPEAEIREIAEDDVLSSYQTMNGTSNEAKIQTYE